MLSMGLAACSGGGDPIAAPAPPVTVSSVTVTPANASLVTGESAALAASVTNSNGSTTTTLPTAWSSSAASVASVSSDGNVLAVSPGTTMVSATVGGKTGVANVVVLGVSTVVIGPSVLALVEGDVRDLQATTTLSNGSSGVRAATWVSNAPVVATVSNTGRVTALSAGTAIISATVGGVSATTTLTIARRVSSIGLNISARALATGETVTLVPTLTFSDNSSVIGKTVTFTSSAAAVASVSATGVVTALTTGVTTVSATVDGRVATALITVRLPAVTILNTAAATSATVGPAGGVLTTSAGGVSYRLEIPANALHTNTLIRMTPIASIGNLPLSGGMVGAVDLQPSGLVFARNATLRIGVTAPPRAGLLLTGFSTADNGTKAAREVAVARVNEVVVLVGHFTAAGAAFGTPADLQSLSPLLVIPSADAELAAQAFFSLASITPPDVPAMVRRLVEWFDLGVLPQLNDANTDAALLSAVLNFDMWSETGPFTAGVFTLVSNDPAIRDRRAQWKAAAIPKLVLAVQGNNQLCSAQQSLTAMQNVLFWQAQAQLYGIGTGALQRTTVLAQLCASLVVSSSNFPDPVQSDFPNDLDAAFALKFGSNPTPRPMPVTVRFTSSGATFAKSSPSNSDAQGVFSVAVTAQGNSLFMVNLVACLALAGAEDVCASHDVNGNSLDVTGSYTGQFSSRIRTTSGTSFPVNVPLNVRLTQNQNGVSGTYEVMQFNGVRGSVSATLAGRQLLNFSLNQFSPCLGLLSGTATVTLPARNIASTYAGSDCSGTHSNGVSNLILGTVGLRDFSGAWALANGSQVWRVRQSGTTVFLSFAAIVNGTMKCAARFRGTVTPGTEVYAATLTDNVAPLEEFSTNARATWQPDLTRQRGARINITNAGMFTGLDAYGPIINPPSGCDP